ncbi:hypothetical protein Vi05172_g3082 [Venturia inaequalis]|nr:hypothetical protein Vi05172_g3082 [Venturia inaequalis]
MRRISALFSTISIVLHALASPVAKTSSSDDVPTANWLTAPQGQKTLPRMAESTPLDGAQRKEILYGPYTVSKTQMFQKKESSPEAPCSQCFVTSMEATLKFDDGREATTAQHGAWLHHIFLVTRVGLFPQPIWAAGNERPTLSLNSEVNKFGIDFPGNFTMAIDLMSEAPQPLDLKLSITYEYILKSQPEAKDYRGSVVLWNDIGNVDAQDGAYSFTSWNQTAPVSGKLLYAMGHMHDGGDKTVLYINNEIRCTSIMSYNARPGYGESTIGNATHHSHGAAKEMHISDPGVCFDFGSVKAGDGMYTRVFYDTDKYPLHSHGGVREKLMGIMRVFVGPDGEGG